MNTQTLNTLSSASRPLTIYCDGAAPNNQHGCPRGGVGLVAYDTQGQCVYEHAEAIVEDGGTTNQRTELYALIHALALSSGEDCIYSDSEYGVKGYNLWMDEWKRKGWRKSGNKAVANVELWKLIDKLKAGRPDVRVIHVKGHAGIAGNEHADRMASRAAQGE